MTKNELITEIRDALEDVMIYQNRRDSNNLIVTISNKMEDLGVESEDVADVEIMYSHLKSSKKFRVLERTSRGMTVVK